MTADVLLVLAPLLVISFLVGALAHPLYKRQVRPNRVYGLRTRATLSDDAVWYEANARSGRDALVWAVANGVLVLALAPFQQRLGTDAYAGICIGATVVGLLLVAARGRWTADRLAAQRARGEQLPRWPRPLPRSRRAGRCT